MLLEGAAAAAAGADEGGTQNAVVAFSGPFYLAFCSLLSLSCFLFFVFIFLFFFSSFAFCLRGGGISVVIRNFNQE